MKIWEWKNLARKHIHANLFKFDIFECFSKSFDLSLKQIIDFQFIEKYNHFVWKWIKMPKKDSKNNPTEITKNTLPPVSSDYRANLSISLTRGKENNCDVRSNCEWSGLKLKVRRWDAELTHHRCAVETRVFDRGNRNFVGGIGLGKSSCKRWEPCSIPIGKKAVECRLEKIESRSLGIEREENGVANPES